MDDTRILSLGRRPKRGLQDLIVRRTCEQSVEGWVRRHNVMVKGYSHVTLRLMLALLPSVPIRSRCWPDNYQRSKGAAWRNQQLVHFA